MNQCLFCHLDRTRAVYESRFYLAIEDKYPVTKGHMLVIPRAHRDDLFQLSVEEFNELYNVLKHLRTQAMAKDETIVGWNVGMNCGKAAGQTIFHCHVHLIPRRDGDVAEPRGGVRGVIPGKQSY